MRKIIFILSFVLFVTMSFAQEANCSISNLVIPLKPSSSFKVDKSININESYIDLVKINPNTEICRCELARYLSLNLRQEQKINYNNLNHIFEMQHFFKKCYSKGFYDDFEGMTQDEAFKYGVVSEDFSPFKGNENKKISFKKIAKIFSGETKYSTFENSRRFIFNLKEKETSSISLQNQQNCVSAAKNYLKNNPDVAKANMDAWNHYTRFGKSEGRKWPDCEDENIKEYVFGNEDRYIGEYNNEGIINGNGIYKFKNGNVYNGQIKLGKFEGKGKLIYNNIYNNQSVYEGNWLDDKKNGIGKEIFSNEDVYEGNYENGLRQGKGIYKTSKLKYEGDWVSDLIEGYGILSSTEGYSYEGNFRKGKVEGKGVYKDSGVKYDGDWVNGLMEGYGIFSSTKGGSYEGNFRKGKMEGTGVLKTPEGSYDGDWVNDKREGCGVSISLDGTIVEGNWLNDKLHGNGKILKADGFYFIGNFENGVLQGRGIAKDLDGIYDGEWINNVIEGYGKYTYNDGQVYEGYFKNNLFSGQGELVLKTGAKYIGGFVEGLMDGYGKLTDKAGKVLYEGYWKNGEYIPESNPNDTVNIGNNSKSSSESTKNSTNIYEIDFDIFGDTKKVLEEFSKNGVANQLSKSGTNINGERCKKCKIVLRTPKNRACYICNKRFSGWGFSKNSDGSYSKEQDKAVYSCHPFFGVHNYKTWSMSVDACCSRNCAMKL